jgi:endonuclease/exonuclease/phosphatase family metal-dependent hydrolase
MSGLALRAVSWNVRNGLAADGVNAWPLRRGRLTAELTELEGDVVGLQEAYDFQIEFVVGQLPRYRFAGKGRRDGRKAGEHCPILFGSRFELVREATVWFGSQPHVSGTKMAGAAHPRIATFARLRDRATDIEIEVVNTHLDHRNQGNRLASAEQLVSYLDEPIPRVVLGDLNAKPGNPVLDVFGRAGYTSALDDGAGGTAHGFEGTADGPRIDYILVSAVWEVVGSQVVRSTLGGRRHASDHWPVVADLRLVQ